MLLSSHLASVYVRQSTPYQVRNNLESKERQYALARRAEQLGFVKVVVIDDDLGRSGAGKLTRYRNSRRISAPDSCPLAKHARLAPSRDSFSHGTRQSFMQPKLAES
jgi:hypothetical protein